MKLIFLLVLIVLVLVLLYIVKPKKRIGKVLQKWVNAMKYGNSVIIQQGTSSLKSQQYFSDYDLFTHVNDKNITPKNVCTNITKILNNLKSIPDIWFIELKIQNKDGSKKKFYENDINCDIFEKTITKLDYLKLDFVIFVTETQKITELSIIYGINTKPPKEDLINGIKIDYEYHRQSGNIYKSLKRAFSIYRIKENKEKMNQLSNLFNSKTGYLYAIVSNLKAIKLILDSNVSKEEDLDKKIKTNLKDISNILNIKLNTINQINKTIKDIDDAIKNDTKIWLKSNKTVLL